MAFTRSFAPVIEKLYAGQTNAINHQVITLPWKYTGDRGSVILIIAPEKKIFFYPEMEGMPDRIRLFTLILYIKVFYQENRLLFTISAYYNQPSSSNIIKAGPDTEPAADYYSGKKYSAELSATEITFTNIKEKLDSLFNTPLREFSLLD